MISRYSNSNQFLKPKFEKKIIEILNIKSDFIAWIGGNTESSLTIII